MRNQPICESILSLVLLLLLSVLPTDKSLFPPLQIQYFSPSFHGKFAANLHQTKELENAQPYEIRAGKYHNIPTPSGQQPDFPFSQSLFPNCLSQHLFLMRATALLQIYLSCIPCFFHKSTYMIISLCQEVDIFLKSVDYLLWKFRGWLLSLSNMHLLNLITDQTVHNCWIKRIFSSQMTIWFWKKLSSKTFVHSVSSWQLTPLQNVNFWSMEYNRYCSQGEKYQLSSPLGSWVIFYSFRIIPVTNRN